MNGEGGGQQTKKNAVLGLKEKRIEDDKRSTTPYMTKYERARVLGTRALQIRYGARGADGREKASKSGHSQYSEGDGYMELVADMIWDTA